MGPALGYFGNLAYHFRRLERAAFLQFPPLRCAPLWGRKFSSPQLMRSHAYCQNDNKKMFTPRAPRCEEEKMPRPNFLLDVNPLGYLMVRALSSEGK